MDKPDLAEPAIVIHLRGRFRLLGRDGTEIALRAVKAQALLVLLVTEPRMTRTRGWLQDKLWSERSAENSANSLRQLLFQLRKALKPTGAVLAAHRGVLQLDPARVRVCRDGAGELLEGLDVRDPEFEAWLAALRAQDRPQPADAPPIPGNPNTALAAPARGPVARTTRCRLMIDQANAADSALGRFETAMGDNLARSLREHLDLLVITPGQSVVEDGTTTGLHLHAHTTAPGRVGLRIAIFEGLGQGADWTDSETGDLPEAGAPPGWPFRQLANRACAALLDLLTRVALPGAQAAGGDANAFAGAAMRRMFSILPGSVEEARTLLQQAHALRPRGLFLAWQAQLAVIDFVESRGDAREELAALADELCFAAMADEATNSNVLAAVSHARLVFDKDMTAALELSELAVTANPGNPLAWSARANALLNAGRTDTAYRAAQAAHTLARDTNLRYWTEFQIATTAVASGRKAQSVAHAERARALNSRYRPALRYLVGLHAADGDLQAARESLLQLQRLEPEVTIDQFIHDDGYPVSMMRNAGLIDRFRFSDL